jgi:hypothetical protein
MNWLDKIVYRLGSPCNLTPAGVGALGILILIGVALLFVVFR